MRLIQQASLVLSEAGADKLYEVDLCELAPDRFVVSFRYGPRGTTLREGTKTIDPVPQAAARQVFESLVAELKSKGYEACDPSKPATTIGEARSNPAATNPPQSVPDPRRLAVLQRLSEGHASRSTWQLSRAVWRAGELRLQEAETLLINLIGSGDAMLDYNIAWALGRLGTLACVSPLKQMEADRSRPDSVRRIAAVALLEHLAGNEREQALEECFGALPAELADLARHGPAEQFTTAFDEYLKSADTAGFGVIDILDLINNEHVRPALVKLARHAPLAPNYFQRLRHVFKAAELRCDAELFGLLAHRFETVHANFSMRYYKRDLTLGPNAQAAFSVQTRAYLRRRLWWTLRRLGELEDAKYVSMAAGVLAAFTDNDARSPRTNVRYDWSAYHRSRTGRLQTITTYFDRYAGYWAFNQILYGRSSRYGPDSGRRYFCCKPPYQPGGEEPSAREEAFPELWQQNPGVLVQLIDQSRCEVVHRFAIKVLRDCPEYCRDLELDSLLTLLRAPYLITTEFAFELAVQRFDPAHPQADLVLGLANCAFEPARQQARRWIEEHKRVLLQQAHFVVALVASSFADTRSFAREVLLLVAIPESVSESIIARLIAVLTSLEPDDGLMAADIAQTLMRVFGIPLRRIGPDVIRDLLGHPLPQVQEFAGDLLLGHESLSRQPPDDLLQALLQADHPTVRGIGVRILDQLPDHELKGRFELLIALVRHARGDLRESIRSTVARLAQGDRDFGRRVAHRLIEELLIPGAPEGVPSHTARVLCEDLRDCMDQVSAELVRRLLASRSGPAQEVGGTLLTTNVRAEDLSVDEIVKLADHEILAVREAAWSICTAKVELLRSQPEAATELLDSKWGDTRQFGFEFFRQHLSDPECLSPQILVGICDSIRQEVQQFGRGLITQVFSDFHGEEYVLKLSEHPSPAMQLFVSNLLEGHASDDVERLRQLESYFVNVLSRVNQGAVAKQRALRFLEQESLKSLAAAEVVARIMSRQSATMAIGVKAEAIEIMTRIRAVYPSIPLPIKVQPLEVRGGV